MKKEYLINGKKLYLNDELSTRQYGWLLKNFKKLNLQNPDQLGIDLLNLIYDNVEDIFNNIIFYNQETDNINWLDISAKTTQEIANDFFIAIGEALNASPKNSVKSQKASRKTSRITQ